MSRTSDGCSRRRLCPRSATASCRCGRVRRARYDRLCDRSRTCAAGTIALVARRCCSVAVADRRERDGTKQKLSVAWRRRTDGTRRLTKARMRPPSECPVASSGLVTDETEIEIREPSRADPEWVARHLRAWWGSTTIVGHGGDWDAARLPALLTVRVEQIVGLATFEVQNVDCHLVTLNALEEGIGVGSTLLDGVIERAAASGCQRVWLTTTNDNLHAMRFYQRRSLRIVAVYPGAVDRARQTKPSIPQIGNDGIHIHDELELQSNRLKEPGQTSPSSPKERRHSDSRSRDCMRQWRSLGLADDASDAAQASCTGSHGMGSRYRQPSSGRISVTWRWIAAIRYGLARSATDITTRGRGSCPSSCPPGRRCRRGCSRRRA